MKLTKQTLLLISMALVIILSVTACGSDTPVDASENGTGETGGAV